MPRSTAENMELVDKQFLLQPAHVKALLVAKLDLIDIQSNPAMASSPVLAGISPRLHAVENRINRALETIAPDFPLKSLPL